MRDALKGWVRPSGVLEAPTIEVVVDENADPDELVRRVRELQARGARVHMRERDDEVITAASDSENPLTGHDEILSARVSDDIVELIVSKEAESEGLEDIGLALAARHGSKARVVVVRKLK